MYDLTKHTCLELFNVMKKKFLILKKELIRLPNNRVNLKHYIKLRNALSISPWISIETLWFKEFSRWKIKAHQLYIEWHFSIFCTKVVFKISNAIQNIVKSIETFFNWKGDGKIENDLASIFMFGIYYIFSV